MDFIEALILGIVQGLTEFLPVSSSGHLLITRNILGVTASPLLFEIMVHAGTLVAVMWVFRKDIWNLMVSSHMVAEIGMKLHIMFTNNNRN